MSGRHFAVENTGVALFVHDLGSSNGTFVNGRQVDRAPAAPQDLITAGASQFRVSIEPDDPATPGPRIDMSRTLPIPCRVTNFLPPSPGETTARRETLSYPQAAARDALYAAGGNVFAYLDVRRDPLIKAFVEASGDECATVLQSAGRRGPSALTYLVALPRDSRLHKVLLNEGWEGRWGIYCSSPAPLQPVAEHLRLIAALETRGGMPFNLPLTDPQFLYAFLSKLGPTEAVNLFGPIQHFFCQAEDGKSLLDCTPGEEGVSIATVRLETKLASAV
jgi:predicted component of type VI protein secretion system